MKQSNKLLLAFSCLLSSTAYAQTCYESLTETTPESQFVLSSDGIVEDTTNGLMWMRCSHGQIWNTASLTCTGSPASVTWQDALQLSPLIDAGGFNDWRLPSVKELATLVEKRCVDPAVNATVFPATSPENYWTATTVSGDHASAWAMAFYNGRNNTKGKQLDVQVRFVRYFE
jgi:hypothetical protein